MELKVPENNETQISISSGVLVNTAQLSIKERLKYVEEDGREQIYRNFNAEMKKRCSYVELLRVQLTNIELLKCFVTGIDLVTIVNLLLVNIFMFFCLKYEIAYYTSVSIIITALIIPISFLITADYQRRDQALACLADIRGRVLTMALHFREFGKVLNRRSEPSYMLNKLIQLCFHLSEFMFSDDLKQTEYLSIIIYQDVSDISQLAVALINDRPSLHPRGHFGSRLFTIVESLISSFEKLQMIKLHRTSHPIRPFAKVMTFIIPVMLVPVQAYYTLTEPTYNTWTAYLITSLQSLILGILINIHDRLYNPFIMSKSDSINKSELFHWISESIEKIFDRHFDTHNFSNTMAHALHYHDPTAHEVLEVY